MSSLGQQTMLEYWKQIFTGTYRVVIKTAFTYSSEDVDVYGIPSTGDSFWDGAMASSRKVMNYAIAELAELHGRHIEFKFEKQADIEKIYHHIEDYVHGVVEMLNRNYITERTINQNEDYGDLLRDIQVLAEFGNYLRPYIAYARGVDDKAKQETITKGISILAKILHAERQKEMESELMPDTIDIRRVMSPRLKGGNERPSRVLKPWRRQKE